MWPPCSFLFNQNLIPFFMAQEIFIEKSFSSVVLCRSSKIRPWSVVASFVRTLDAVSHAWMLSVNSDCEYAVAERNASPIIIIDGLISSRCLSSVRVCFE